jgi:hypothetical protein
MPGARQAPHQQIAVGCIVVHNQDPTALRETRRIQPGRTDHTQRSADIRVIFRQRCGALADGLIGEVDQGVDARQHALNGGEQAGQVGDQRRVARVARVFGQHFAIALDRVHRGTQIVAQLDAVDHVAFVREHGAQQILQRGAGGLDALQVGNEIVEAEPRCIFNQHLGIAEDRGRRGREFLAQMGEQRALKT